MLPGSTSSCLCSIWGLFSINKGGTLQSSLITKGSAISGYRSCRGKGEQLPPSLPPAGQAGKRQRKWRSGKQEVWSLIKAVPGSVTLTSRALWALSRLIPATGGTLTCCDPWGTKIHIIFYFTFMSSCVIKIKSNLSQRVPGSVSLFFFLLSPIFSSSSPSLLSFEVLIRFYWCMKAKCRLYIGDHFTAPGSQGAATSKCVFSNTSIGLTTAVHVRAYVAFMYSSLRTGLNLIYLDTWSQSCTV